MEKLLKLIGQHEVFAALSPRELKTLAPIIHQQTYEEGAVLFDINQRANYLFYIESGSFILHLANNEYKTLQAGQLFGEIGIINEDFRSGTVWAAEDSTVIGINGTSLFKEEEVNPAIALKIVRALGRRIIKYLRSKEQISTQELIELGETEHVEFKSTLRWNLFTDKKDKAIEHAALKTIAAFMNAEGGTLIVGVADDGEILGLKRDQFSSHDKLLLHLTKLIKDRIGTLHIPFLNFSVENITNKNILRIDCLPATHPAYLKDGNDEHFYIRTGPATTDLKLSKVYDYIKGRFERFNG
jgi:CRP-like cAMP-binding protein